MFAMMDLDTGFLCDPRLGKRDLKVLIALCAHADRQDGGCFPSRKRISEITGLLEESLSWRRWAHVVLKSAFDVCLKLEDENRTKPRLREDEAKRR